MSSQILVRYLYKAPFAGTTSAVTTAGKPSESDTLHYQRISVYTHNMRISYTPNTNVPETSIPIIFLYLPAMQSKFCYLSSVSVRDISRLQAFHTEVFICALHGTVVRKKSS